MYKMMTPGPTQVRENVRKARSREFQNPDQDLGFLEYYKETCELISKMLYTKNETLVLGGEGILGLEAACASLTEPGDRVLVLDNGIFGNGFKDFISIYGGDPVLYTKDYSEPFRVDELAVYLEQDHDFKYATVVHCDTPGAMLNNIAEICPLLKSYGIMTVVDAVSSMFGVELKVDDCRIDVLCGGSQKVVSAPPGLSLVTVSEAAKRSMEERKTPVASFYANLMIFKDYFEKKWFPYTMPASDIYGLREALENIKGDPDILNRHERIAAKVRKSLQNMGLTLYPGSGFSNTVTAFVVPKGHTSEEILTKMREEHNILLAGSFGCFDGKLIRIGHMGENATDQNMDETLKALKEVLMTR